MEIPVSVEVLAVGTRGTRFTPGTRFTRGNLGMLRACVGKSGLRHETRRAIPARSEPEPAVVGPAHFLNARLATKRAAEFGNKRAGAQMREIPFPVLRLDDRAVPDFLKI